MGGVPLAIRTAITLLTLCLAAGTASAQSPDAKRAFTEALGRFSAALDGRYGDDGARLAASLSAMDGRRSSTAPVGLRWSVREAFR